MQTRKEILPGGSVLYTAEHHLIGTDALLLAKFSDPKRGWDVCEFGSGCGTVILSLLDSGLKGRAVGVEIDLVGSLLLKRAIEENGFANAEAVNSDFRDYKPAGLFDLVVANPPYFSVGETSPRTGRAAARHEIHGKLEDWCFGASHILKDGGRLCICFAPGRMAELISVLRANRLEPKRLLVCRKAAAAPPWMIMIDARKAGGVGLNILPDFILSPTNGLTF